MNYNVGDLVKIYHDKEEGIFTEERVICEHRGIREGKVFYITGVCDSALVGFFEDSVHVEKVQ